MKNLKHLTKFFMEIKQYTLHTLKEKRKDFMIEFLKIK